MKRVLTVALMIIMTGVLMSSDVMAAQDKTKQPDVPYQTIENARLVRGLINHAEENSDPILFMAAAKLIESAGSVAILKKPMDSSSEELADNNLWIASELYAKAAELAGKSELGEEASLMAKESAKPTNTEGCWGYTHYHYYEWRDANNNYRYRIYWHNC